MSVRLRMVGYSHGSGVVSLGNHGYGIMSRKATPSMIFLKKQLPLEHGTDQLRG